MKKLIGLCFILGLTGCATTHTVDEPQVIVRPPRVIHVHPYDPWRHHHHWHWSWHYRHGWSHPRNHYHVYPVPPRKLDDQRRTTPVNPGRSGGPSGEHAK